MGLPWRGFSPRLLCRSHSWRCGAHEGGWRDAGAGVLCMERHGCATTKRLRESCAMFMMCCCRNLLLANVAGRICSRMLFLGSLVGDRVHSPHVGTSMPVLYNNSVCMSPEANIQCAYQ